LFHRLDHAGRIERLVDEADVLHAVTEPPRDTRAFFRGRCLARYAAQISAASWDSVIFDLPGYDSLQRVPTMDPLRGTAEHVEALFERSATASELFAAITGR